MKPLEQLKPKEVAVLNAIISRRIDGDSDIFRYDCKEIQEYLNKTGSSRKPIITLDAQRKIVKDLSERRILDTDQIIDNRLNNVFHFKVDPYCIDVTEPKPDFSWKNHTYWAREEFQTKEGLSIEEAFAKYGNTLFIKMTEKHIETIDYNYMPSHKIQLAFDRKNPYLCIKFDDENWKCISRLNPTKSPYKILKYALAHPNKRITRKDLSDNNIVKESRSLNSQVFSDNEVVKALEPLLLEKDSDSILVRKSVAVTLCEMNELKAALKKIRI